MFLLPFPRVQPSGHRQKFEFKTQPWRAQNHVQLCSHAIPNLARHTMRPLFANIFSRSFCAPLPFFFFYNHRFVPNLPSNACLQIRCEVEDCGSSIVLWSHPPRWCQFPIDRSQSNRLLTKPEFAFTGLNSVDEVFEGVIFHFSLPMAVGL